MVEPHHDVAAGRSLLCTRARQRAVDLRVGVGRYRVANWDGARHNILGECPGLIRSEKPNHVSKPYAPADLWREVFDERRVISVQAVADVEHVDRELVREVPLGNSVGRLQVDHGVAGSARLGRKRLLLVARNNDFGIIGLGNVGRGTLRILST